MSARLAIPVFVTLVLALGGCGLGDDGPRTTQTRDVGRFTSIDNRDSVDVRLRVGPRQRVRVRAGSKVIDDVTTEVVDGQLRVSYDEDDFFDSAVDVEVSVPRLNGIQASGSGDVDAVDIDARRFEVRADGSGDLGLMGRAGTLALDVDGSGDADLSSLAARDARVTTDGSGDTDLRVGRRLAINVGGSGEVRYYGEPALKRHIDGSGEVRAAD
jgi:hypothetical protein